jgi:hypothetical protein
MLRIPIRFHQEAMMAYLDLAGSPFKTRGGVTGNAAPDRVEPALGPIERQVISASLRDPVWSLAPSGRVRRMLHWIFDIRRPNPIADARLEALRRFAVLALRFGDRLDSTEADRLAVAGYSPSQIREAARHVAAARAERWTRDAR